MYRLYQLCSPTHLTENIPSEINRRGCSNRGSTVYYSYGILQWICCTCFCVSAALTGVFFGLLSLGELIGKDAAISDREGAAISDQ